MAFKKWRPGDKGESFRVDRYRCIEGRCLTGAVYIKSCPQKPSLTKTKTALKQETYNLSDLPVKLEHDVHCGFVELGGSESVSVSSES